MLSRCLHIISITLFSSSLYSQELWQEFPMKESQALFTNDSVFSKSEKDGFSFSVGANTGEESGFISNLSTYDIREWSSKKWSAKSLIYLHLLHREQFFYSRQNGNYFIHSNEKKQFSPLKLGNETYLFMNVNYKVSFQASQAIQIFHGFNNPHLGYGWKSPILNRESFPFPYLGIQANMGMFKYRTQLNYMAYQLKTPKWSVIHTLEFIPSKKIRFYASEIISWPHKQSGNTRGVELAYLNPVIILRPVEFNIGSPDNMLIAFGGETSIFNTQFYGQIVLDEFLLKEATSTNGWWGNKYAINLGSKKSWTWKNKQIQAFGEINIVRPYMYSHGLAVQGWTHYGQPLANPLGSNFKEILLGVAVIDTQWSAIGRISSWKKGENDHRNFGGNPLRTYDDRISDYGNEIGQGIKHRGLNIETHIYKKLHSNKDSPWLFLKAGVYQDETGNNKHTSPYILAGITTSFNIWSPGNY